LILPKILSEDELARLFNALNNLKHKAMLFTAYSAGLRVSEIAALKIKHIDSKQEPYILPGQFKKYSRQQKTKRG
jgi:integrase